MTNERRDSEPKLPAEPSLRGQEEPLIHIHENDLPAVEDIDPQTDPETDPKTDLY